MWQELVWSNVAAFLRIDVLALDIESQEADSDICYRSFTLADAGCSKPGCAFSGASKPGPCSATEGILSYYEIKNILNGASTKKRDAITPTHDEKSAVNYFTFDNDQWVSYDDDRTFKQKVDWANGVGMGGGLIWASDLGTPGPHCGSLIERAQETADCCTRRWQVYSSRWIAWTNYSLGASTPRHRQSAVKSAVYYTRHSGE